MSRENVEIVRQLTEAAQRGVDDGDPGAIFDTGLLADDAEWVLPIPFEGKSVWRGRREYAEFMRVWTGEFEDFSFGWEPLIDAGDDRVVAISHTRAREVQVMFNNNARDYAPKAARLQAAGQAQD